MPAMPPRQEASGQMGLRDDRQRAETSHQVRNFHRLGPELGRKRKETLGRLRQFSASRKVSVPDLLKDHAVHHLSRRLPAFSARTVLSGGQKLFFVLSFFLVLLGLYAMANQTVFLLGLLATAFYLGSTLLRGVILADVRAVKRPDQGALRSLALSTECGTCSVLVALYQEAGQVLQLVDALSKLVWAEGKLEIFLICEADDRETLSTIDRIDLPGHMTVVRVPPCQPRTKPKALNYVLPLCNGEQLVLYDAEDRPHPLQLLEARQKFLASPPDLACLQAPLLIHNRSQSWLSQLFSVEYSTLFLGILPFIERWKLPMPLGGTSNHFKTAILRKVGGWDPYNVTEDADLGIRLSRYGYRCGTLRLPTLEEAPSTLGNWVPQRTRWMKGWMQTLLVHLRHPGETFSQIGLAGSALFLLMLLAVIVSALVHPLFLISTLLFVPIAMAADPDWLISTFLGLSVFNLVGGYTTYGLLAFTVSTQTRYSASPVWLLLLPLYWLAISWAAWRALFHLVAKPFHWEKTAHVLSHDAPSPSAPDFGDNRHK